MRRIRCFKTVVVAALLVTSSLAQAQSSSELARKLELLKAYPEVIVVNGRIATLDAQQTQVQAMAIKNNRIVALGGNDEIRFLAGPTTEVLDAKGRTVLPGLIDSHTHPHLWLVAHRLGAEGDITAQRYNDPQLRMVLAKGKDGAEILRDLERVVLQRAQELGPGKWILATVFGGKDLPESRKIVVPLFPGAGTGGALSVEYLDKLAPNNPLMVFGNEAIGPVTKNSKARQVMAEILGPEYVDDGSTRTRPRILWDILLRGKTEVKLDLLKRELLECLAAHGVTTLSNHYYGTPSILKVYNLLNQRNELPVRYAWYQGSLWPSTIQEHPSDPLSFYFRNLGDARGIGNDYIWNAGVSSEGWEQDVKCTRATPLSSANPRDLIKSCSEPIAYEQDGGYRHIRAAIESGLRIGYLHGYSDGTYDSIFHMIDDLVARGKVTLEEVRAAHISFEHNPMIRPDQIEKFAKYGLVPSFNGYQVQGDIKGGAFLKAYGEQYMNWMMPMKSLVDSGVHAVFNTDTHLTAVPVEWKDMDYPPQWDGSIWPYMEFFVTRRMPHDGITYNRSEAVDRLTILKAATIWAAERIHNEKNIGSLEVGKLADIMVIDKDYFTIPEDQIHTIKTLLTAVGGKVVFKDRNY